jgi:hypothetical protein
MGAIVFTRLLAGLGGAVGDLDSSPLQVDHICTCHQCCFYIRFPLGVNGEGRGGGSLIHSLQTGFGRLHDYMCRILGE